MLTDLRYVTGQLRRAQRHLADRRDAGVADALAKALDALQRRIDAEEKRTAAWDDEYSAPWTVEEILSREG